MSATIYYKATQPDGTDFYTGTILYAVGKRVRPHKFTGTPSVCGPGVLHAADVPAMTLVGGSWPCRLFEVTGKPIVGFDTSHQHKGGFRQLTVVREIDAHLALGPNGRYVAGVIERSRQLTHQEVIDLADAGDAAGADAGDAAWAAAGDAARDAARAASRDAAWDGARDGAGAAAWDAAGLSL